MDFCHLKSQTDDQKKRDDMVIVELNIDKKPWHLYVANNFPEENPIKQ